MADAALTDVPRSSEEWRAFLQRRIAGFGRTLASFVLGFYVFSNAFAMLHPKAQWADWASPLNLLVLASGLVCGVVWLACRRTTTRSLSELETIDALGTIATASAIGLAAVYAPPVQRPELSSMMGVIIFIVLRAIVIPSTGARTFVLSALSVLPSIYGAYACHAKEPPADYTLPLALYPALTAVWAGLGVTAATLASRVIFGLRRRASEARKLGQYMLGEKIGEGGMGVVYRASHAMMKREVAIKLLSAERAGKDALVRFEREVQLTSRLSSPHTIQIYDYGRTPAGLFYYVMEYLDGYSLEDLVERFGPLPAGRVIHLTRQICAALAEAHAVGLIHRDIKPANVAICERAGVYDVVKVLDFGLVKELGTDTASTATAALTGTPLYLSPESIRSPSSIDGRSDLYAVGAVAYYLLTGTHVFEAETIVEVCSHHLHTPPEPPNKRVSGVPRDLEDVVLACLAKSPSDRPPDARALEDALLACEAAEDWSDDLAEAWWKTHRAEAAAARPKISQRESEMPSAVEVDLAPQRSGERGT